MARTDATIILCVSDVRYLLAVAFSWCCCGCDAPSIWPVWLTINEQGHELDWLYVLCPCFPSIQARLLRLRRLLGPVAPAALGRGSSNCLEGARARAAAGHCSHASQQSAVRVPEKDPGACSA